MSSQALRACASAVLGVSVVAALLSAPPTSATTAQPTATSSPTIVYVKSESGINTVIKGTLFGSSLTGLSELAVPGTPVDVASNAQGTHAAIVTKDGASSSLYLVLLADGSTTLLSQAAQILDPSFSPAGDTLVFSVSETAAARPHVRVISTAGQVVADLTQLSPAYSPALSPDGRWVAYAKGTRGLDESFPLMVADTMGVGETTEVKTFGRGGAMDIVWAPDGSSIGYTMFTGNHYGVALTDPWGKCSETVLFEDQPTGKNNALFYHFGGFTSPTQMVAFLEDRATGRGEVRIFAADTCSRSFTGLVKGTTIVPAFSGSVLSASSSWSSAGFQADIKPVRLFKTSQESRRLEIGFSAPASRGYGPLKVTYRGPDGVSRLAWEGFKLTGSTDIVRPATTYNVDGFIAPWQTPAVNVATSDTYRTPDETTLEVAVSSSPPASERYVPGAVRVSGRLLVTASSFGLPYQKVAFSLEQPGSDRAKQIASTTTDADGYFEFDANVSASGTLVANYVGDDDRFGAFWERKVKVSSLALKVRPGLSKLGGSVTWSVAIKPNVTSARVRLECYSGTKWSTVRTFPGKKASRSLVLKATPNPCRAVLPGVGIQLVYASSPRRVLVR